MSITQRVASRFLNAKAVRETIDPNLAAVRSNNPSGGPEDGSQFPPARDNFGYPIDDPESEKKYTKNLIHKLMTAK